MTNQYPWTLATLKGYQIKTSFVNHLSDCELLIFDFFFNLKHTPSILHVILQCVANQYPPLEQIRHFFGNSTDIITLQINLSDYKHSVHIISPFEKRYIFIYKNTHLHVILQCVAHQYLPLEQFGNILLNGQEILTWKNKQKKQHYFESKLTSRSTCFEEQWNSFLVDTLGAGEGMMKNVWSVMSRTTLIRNN